MNIHHLELFYYVAQHGGISEAVRNMPYGIQQPAVSAQILQLEDHLGTPLFRRRPFSLTAAGEKLYRFIEPFFGNLGELEAELREGPMQLLRIGASAVILREHLPNLLQALRQRHNRLKFTLRSGLQPELERWLQHQEIDIALTVLEGRPQTGIRSQVLIKLPLVLLVHRDDPLQNVEELWKSDRIESSLITLPPSESISRHFQQTLARRHIDWPPGIEINSLDLIETYVARRFGIGVTVAVPQRPVNHEIRILPLPDFPPIAIGAMWFGRLNPPTRALLQELQAKADAAARQLQTEYPELARENP